MILNILFIPKNWQKCHFFGMTHFQLSFIYRIVRLKMRGAMVMIIKRDTYLNQLIAGKHNGLIKVA